MSKEFKNLPSEQIPNDGGWYWDRLIDEANERLKKIGKRGKRATIKKVKPGKPMSVQFSLNGKQVNPGIDLSMTRSNLIEAEKICSLITGQLVADTFTMDWFYSLVGKSEKVNQPEKPLTCGEMLEQYKTHYFKQRKSNKSPEGTWGNSYRHTEKALLKHKDSVINLKIVREVIDCTKNNSIARTRYLDGLANILKYFDNNEFKQVIKRYKSENNPKRKDKYIPTDSQIDYVYQTGFEINKHCSKNKRYRYAQWQFLYSLLATYGLRVHEAWNIKNWDEPVKLKAGDWIAIADDSSDINDESENGKFTFKQIEQDEVIPAILDPDNEDYLLCIGHKTKTGYRVAFPMSPSGVGSDCDWIEKFNIVQPMNLPDIENPLDHHTSSLARRCALATAQWFNPVTKRRKNQRNNTPDESDLRYGFTAHSLRHAYNIRGHKLGINQKMLADGLGHGLDMNSRTYMRHEQGNSKIQGLKQGIAKFSQKQSELERANEKIKHLEAENEKLRTELAMYRALEQNKSNS